MLDNANHNSSCPRESELVEYLYREMPSAETENFELHLENCSECVDGLAALAQPHLAVYEWRRAEFDLLATPAFAVPSSKAQSAEIQEGGWLSGIGGFLKAWPLTMRLGTGFAALAVVGFSILTLMNSFKSPDVAGNGPQSVLPAAVEPIASAPESGPAFGDVSKQSNADEESAKEGRPVDTARIKPAPPPPRVRVTGPRIQRTEVASSVAPARPKRRSLRLSGLDEEEDTSLRLADLFEDVGSE